MTTILSYREFFVTADKSTIKKCEDLLEKLPTEVAKPVSRKPMWSFLRSIEGFDTIRAAKCLGMLLDAEYGTMSGLKLATTQDLVEVVGLMQEDALRIVHAARNADLEPDTVPKEAVLPWASEPREQSDSCREVNDTSLV